MPERPGGSAPLTRSQREFLAYEEQFPGSRMNALYGLGEFAEACDDGTLRSALRLLTENEQGLRLRLHRSADGEIRQYDAVGAFDEPAVFRFADAQERRRFLEEECRRGLPLLDAPLCRFSVLREEGRLYLLVAAHHAAADGYMLSLLASRVGTLCRQLRRGETPALTPHFVFPGAWAEDAAFRSPRRTRDLAWWRAQYEDWDGLCRLTPGRVWNGDPAGARLERSVDPALWQRLTRFCEAEGLSPAVPFEAAWALLLRLRNPGKRRSDICLNLHSRDTVEARDTVGAFAAGRLLCVRPEAGDSFAALCRKTAEATVRAVRRFTVQSDELLELARERYPDADSVYDLECSYLPPVGEGGVRKTWLSNHMPETTAEFTLFHLNADERPRLLLDYRCAVLPAPEAETLLSAMLALLERGLAAPEAPAFLGECHESDS